jgi:hypothetical protein
MQRSPAADYATVQHHKFPSMGHGSQDGPSSSNPDAHPSGREPETAEEVQEEESSAGGMAQWAKRLQNLEEGQKRIEALLVKLSKDKN